jgi:hypothetical protein
MLVSSTPPEAEATSIILMQHDIPHCVQKKRTGAAAQAKDDIRPPLSVTSMGLFQQVPAAANTICSVDDAELQLHFGVRACRFRGLVHTSPEACDYFVLGKANRKALQSLL